MTEPPPSDLVDALADRYRIDREIGRGGSAVVYAALDRRHGRSVAVKVLSPELAEALGPERFLREIRVAPGLAHPHILPVFDSGAEAGYLYYVMPLASGGSLRDRLVREVQLTVDDAIAIAREVAEALHVAHGAGIVHRDVKPENILFEGGHALVADFGTARLLSVDHDTDVSSGGLAIGTPAYMSPEQATAQQVIDARSDIYSLAIVLYEMLAGATPFASATPRTTLARHVHEAPPPLAVARPSVPPWLVAIVERALDKVPADRYESALAFSHALRLPTAEMAAVALPQSRSWTAVSLAGGLAVAVLAALAIWRATATGGEPHITSADPRQVAVMYFDDLSRNGELRDVADGLTTDLISELAAVESLSVRSALAVRSLRGASLDSIVRTLRVGTLVAGTVRGSRDTIVVRITMTDPEAGRVVGQSTWQRPRRELFAIQRDITTEVARLVREHVGVEVRARARRATTANVDAWFAYQLGERLRRDALQLRARGDTAGFAAGLARADSVLARAARLDDRWPLPLVARAGLALQSTLPGQSGTPAEERSIRSALRLADEALDRAPDGADALFARGRARVALALTQPLRDTLMLAEAEADLRRAAGPENPERPRVLAYLSTVLRARGDFAGAHEAAENAIRADAFLADAKQVLDGLCGTSVELRSAADLAHWCEEGRRRFPKHWGFAFHQLYFATLPGVPRQEAARTWALVGEMRAKAPPSFVPGYLPQWEAMAAGALARAGLADSARRVLGRATVAAAGDPRFGSYEAMAQLALGDREAAIATLERFVARFPTYREFMRPANPLYAEIATDPRFVALGRAPAETVGAPPRAPARTAARSGR